MAGALKRALTWKCLRVWTSATGRQLLSESMCQITLDNIFEIRIGNDVVHNETDVECLMLADTGHGFECGRSVSSFSEF